MDRYYCPYCSPKYQFHKQTNDGLMICGQCGEPLIKTSFINPVRVFALIAASAFIAPLIILIIKSFTFEKGQELKGNLASLTLVEKIFLTNGQ